MKKIIIIVTIIIVLVGAGLYLFNKNSDAIYASVYANRQIKDGVITKGTFEYDDLDREYLLYISDDLDENAPLVFVLHGYTGSMEIVYRLSKMDELAEKYGFAVCYPNGTLLDGKHYWNAQFSYEDAADDIGFLVGLAEKLQSEYKLDADKTYACGMSNGGYMSYALGVNASETFSKIASVAGITSYQTWENREVAQPVSVLQIYGLEDRVVSFQGSEAIGSGWMGAPSIDIIMDFFADLNGCTEQTQEYSDNITTTKYTGGENPVWLIVGDNWGHEWPNDETFFASEVIVEFFELD